MTDTKEIEALIADIGKAILGEGPELLAVVLSRSAGALRALLEEREGLQSAMTIPDDALPPDGQEWAKVSPEVAFHLIERHGENWAHIGQLMEAWRDATTGELKRDAERYRWLRDATYSAAMPVLFDYDKPPGFIGLRRATEHLDRAIDGARQASKEQHG